MAANAGRPPVAGWFDLSALAWSCTLLALFAQLVVYLAHAATILPYPFDIDQGEGYDVNAAWLLAQGRSIYTDNQTFPYFSSNYPPLYSLAVAAAVGVWGPTLLAGRMVSLLATLGLGGLIVLAARARTNAAGGLAAGGAFWLSSYVFHVTPLARVNALTALLALGGLLCVGRARPAWVAGGGLLLLAALFAKPTAIDAIAAALGGLAFGQRRLAVLLGAALGTATLVIAGLLELTTNQAFSLNVLLGNVNPFLADQLRDYLWNFSLLHAVPLLIAVAATIVAFRARRVDGVHLFFVTGLVSALGVGKWGAGESYFLSAIVASSILVGDVAGRLAARGDRLGAAVAVALLGQCLVSAHGIVSARLPLLPDRGLQAAALGTEPSFGDLERGFGIVTRLQTTLGEGLVEDPGFELAAGKPVVGNATHLRNLHQAGLWDPANLVADLVARRYHTVVLDAELYPEPVLVAIGRHYFLYDSVPVYQATQQVFLPGAS